MPDKLPEKPLPEEALLRDGIEYEEVSHDDQVIGRAFRGSLIAFGVLGAAGAGVFWWMNRTGEAPPPQVADVEEARTSENDVTTPSVRFRDVTREVGIDFVHENGAEGEKLLPETMGGGSAWVDHDGDGDVDLILVNGDFWPNSKRQGQRPTQRFYDNDGSGHFTDTTENLGLDVSFYGMGAWCADADGDGDVDAFFTAVGPNHYFAADGGRFQQREVGLEGDDDSWSSCAVFFDAENDGDLDLYVGNYVRWSRAIDLEQGFSLTGIGRAYGPPATFEGAQPYFYRNDGAGHFEDATIAAGIQVTNPATGGAVGKALGARASDLDLDGDLDLMVANDTVANFLYRNRGDGTFEERGKELGLAFDRDGKATGAMGIDAAWFRNDDSQGIAIGNFANEMSSFYVSQGRADLWADEAIGNGVGARTRKHLSFGALFLDYDLDGRVDYLQANGHLESEINQVQKSQTYEQEAQLFWNAGPQARATFVEVPSSSLGDLGRPIVGRGVSAADYDGDGDLDVLLTQSGGRPLLLQNEQTLGHHWLRLALVGRTGNRAAIGARVECWVGGVRQCQELIPFRSYLSQCEGVLTFGLGTATEVERVRVHWPGGEVQDFEGLAVDRLHRLEQGD